MYMYTSVCIHTHKIECYAAKKEWNNVICSYVGEPRVYHAKWSKWDRGAISSCHLWVEYKIWHKWTYLQNRATITEIENKLTVTRVESGGNKLEVWG